MQPRQFIDLIGERDGEWGAGVAPILPISLLFTSTIIRAFCPANIFDMQNRSSRNVLL